MALLSYVIKIKKVLFSKLACWFYQVTFFCMKCPIKRRVLFKKTCLKKVVYTWKKLFTEKIIMSHNAKYYVVFKSEITYHRVVNGEIIFRRKYSAYTALYMIHWQILQLMILAVPVRRVSQKKKVIPWYEVKELIVFFLYAVEYNFVNTVFSMNCFCQFKGSLWVKQKFALIAKKLNSIVSLTAINYYCNEDHLRCTRVLESTSSSYRKNDSYFNLNGIFVCKVNSREKQYI